MTANHSRLLALLSAILVAAALRLVPHPPNFTPIGAMALFSGAYLGRRALAFVAPLGALLLSDVVLGFYHGQATVYFSVALIVLIGMVALARAFRRCASAPRPSRARSCSSSITQLRHVAVQRHVSAQPPPASRPAMSRRSRSSRIRVAGDLFYATLLFGGFRLAELLAAAASRGQGAATRLNCRSVATFALSL